MHPFEAPTTSLHTRHGQSIPLQGVRARGRLDGLVFQLEVEQRYLNPLAESLEAIYTFPLPSGAVLLGLELEVAGQTLVAVATAKAEAKRRYEKAIDEGDTTVLLEHNGHGLYTVSLGHLRAGETAVIRYRYVELLDAFEGYARLAVPTVIAPRYGNAADAGLEGPAIPSNSFLAEYPFDIEVVLAGLHQPAGVRSPSHAVHTAAVAEGLRISLSRPGYLDQDFVLQLQAAALPQRALVAPDGDGWAVLASPAHVTDEQPNRPFTVKVLLDCSGSMGGESIESAKRALTQFLTGLSVEDRFSLTCFGSSHQHITEGLETLDEAVRAAILLRVRDIDANLGGTDIADALDATLAIRAPRGTDILLITDGEVFDINSSLEKTAKRGHRLFVVAIGVAPNEALATALATQTGGAVEFVRDEQDAQGAILRMFKRLRTPAADVGEVDWAGAAPAWSLPVARQVFNGDTLHLAAGFNRRPAGTVSVAVGQGTLRCPIPAEEVAGDWLPRLLAARRLRALPATEAQALAVRHNLASEYTSLIVVAKREDGQKPQKLPVTVAVPQMELAENLMEIQACASPILQMSRSVICEDRSAIFDHDADSVDLIGRSFPRVGRSLARPVSPSEVDASEAAALLEHHFRELAAGLGGIETLAGLAAAGASSDVIDQLEALVDNGMDEADVVAAFLAWLLERFPPSPAPSTALVAEVGARVAERRFRRLRSAVASRFGNPSSRRPHFR